MKTRTRSALLTLTLALCVGLAHGQNDGKVARYYEDALKRYERKDYAGATAQLKKALQVDKNQLAVHLLLGKTLLASADVANAEVEFNEALRLGVNRSEVVVPLAQTLLGQGKSSQVYQDNRLRPDGLPKPVLAELLLLRSAAYADVGDKRAAMDALTNARSVNPADPASWLAEVPLRLRAGQLREATAAAEQALRLAPGSAEAHYQKGSVLHVQGQLQAAMAEYAEALKIDAGHIDSLRARAGILIDLGRYTEASADVANLQSLVDVDPRVSYLSAMLLDHAGDAAGARDALKDVTEFLDAVPIDYLRYRIQTLMLNGMAHFALGEYEKAKPYLDMAYRQQPGSALAKVVAQIAIAEPNPTRAVEVLDDYLKARPNDAQALLMLASVHMSQGRYSKASSLMEAALRANDAPEFHTTLGLSLMRSGQGSMALPELEKAFRADPAKQTAAGLAMADIYLRTGNLAKARDTVAMLIKSAPDNPMMYVVQGRTRTRSGDLSGARQSFEKALKLSGDLQTASLGLAHVDILDKKFDAAESRLRGLLRSNDRDVDALFEMATLEEQRGRDDQVLKWLEASVDASTPRQTQPNQALIAWHLRKNSPKKALEAAKMLVAKAPDDLEALRSYARAKAANGDLAGARATLGDAVRHAGFEAPALVSLAQEELDAGDLNGAAYAADKALSAAPDFLPAQVLMAGIELRQGFVDKSERRALAIVQTNPRLPVGFELLADIANQRGRASQVVDQLRQAHAIENSTRTLLKLFKAEEAVDTKTARDLLENWIKTHPRDLDAVMALGDAQARAGNLAQARRQYEAAIKLQPVDVAALNNLANVLLLQNDPAASSVAEKALSLRPNEPVVLDTAGWAAFSAGNRDRALQLLRDARLRAPGNPEIRYHLGAVLAKTDRKKEARDELGAALSSLGPGQSFQGEKEARALYDSLK